MRTKACYFLLLGIALLIAGTLLWPHVRQPASTHHSTRGVVSGPAAAQQAAVSSSNEIALAAPPTGTFVSGAIRPILGLSQESPAVRWAAVRALGTHLNQAERTALYDYLRGHEAEPAGPMRGVVKNDVILALKRQQPPPQELAGALAGMFYDKEQDPMIRNYALQHLASWYGQCSEKREIVDALWAGTTDTDASTVGTALIGLSRLSQASAPVDTVRLTTAATTVAVNPSGNETARITALQVCSQLGVKDVLPVAVNLAGGSGTVPLRVSALAAVGALGGADQIPWLNRLLEADDARIQTAARTALRRLEARPNG